MGSGRAPGDSTDQGRGAWEGSVEKVRTMVCACKQEMGFSGVGTVRTVDSALGHGAREPCCIGSASLKQIQPPVVSELMPILE